jgi:hypothetical protein
VLGADEQAGALGRAAFGRPSDSRLDAKARTEAIAGCATAGAAMQQRQVNEAALLEDAYRGHGPCEAAFLGRPVQPIVSRSVHSAGRRSRPFAAVNSPRLRFPWLREGRRRIFTRASCVVKGR